ncbi:MAG: GGDEF domain-containing protein [Pseudomonadota bacterium]
MEDKPTVATEIDLKPEQVDVRLTADLFDQSPTILLGTAFLGIFCGAFYWGQLPVLFYVAWLCCLSAAFVLRLVLLVLYRSDAQRLKTGAWRNGLAISAGLQGIAGSTLTISAVHNLSPDAAVVALASLIGTVGISVATSSASVVITRLLTLLTLVPVVPVLLLSESQALQYLGGLSFVFVFAMSRASGRIHHTVRNSIESSYRSEALAASLYQQTRIDPLTGLLNRRALNQSLAQAANSGTQVGLVLCDVDYFKQYNDSLGHQAGDECLKRVAIALRGALRASDPIVARFGGEEFAILLSDCPAEQLEDICSRLRNHVVDERIPHPSSRVGPYVTVSVGAAHLHEPTAGHTDRLISHADSALYEAKAAGRNRSRIRLAA